MLNPPLETPETAITLPTAITKIDIMYFVEYIKQMHEGGMTDALSIYVRAKAMAKAMELIIAELEDAAYDEAGKYPGKSFEAHSAQITKKEGADIPDVTRDVEYMQIKQALKDREELLKMAYKSRDKVRVIHPETGEELPIMPPKPTKQTLSIQII